MAWEGVAVLTRQHLGVGAVGDGEQVGRHLISPLASVHLHHAVRVDGEPLVGIDHHAEQARVSLLAPSKQISQVVRG